MTGNAAEQERMTLVVVVLRLSLSGAGTLRHGEVVDVNERVRGRFYGWDGLVPALSRFLTDEGHGADGRSDP